MMLLVAAAGSIGYATDLFVIAKTFNACRHDTNNETCSRRAKKTTVDKNMDLASSAARPKSFKITSYSEM